MRLTFIAAKKAEQTVMRDAQGLHAWQARPDARDDRRLKVLVHTSFAESRRNYGSPRVHDDLIDWQERVARRVHAGRRPESPGPQAVQAHDMSDSTGGRQSARPAVRGGGAESTLGHLCFLGFLVLSWSTTRRKFVRGVLDLVRKLGVDTQRLHRVFLTNGAGIRRSAAFRTASTGGSSSITKPSTGYLK